MTLAAMIPANELASTRYCLANRGSEHLVYLPDGGMVALDLSDAPGEFRVQWHEPATGKATDAGVVAGGMRRDFKAPFEADALLYLVRRERR
jgi:hypothetical protein